MIKHTQRSTHIITVASSNKIISTYVALDRVTVVSNGQRRITAGERCLSFTSVTTPVIARQHTLRVIACISVRHVGKSHLTVVHSKMFLKLGRRTEPLGTFVAWPLQPRLVFYCNNSTRILRLIVLFPLFWIFIVQKSLNHVSTTMLGQFQSGVKTILFRLAYGT